MQESVRVTHAFPPVFRADSRVLVLGTMPSPKSRENGFYYSHPQNRFWPVMAALLDEPLPRTPEEKRALVLNHRIALWDVLQSCEIRGAGDASIRKPVANPIGRLLEQTKICAVFATGQKAAALYTRYCFPRTHLPVHALPSTSPANCRVGMDALLESYRGILPFLRGEEEDE
ncbi:MAG: DNA-deoxyinosine glycosylase [Candidatus Heritagella sp.]